MGECIGIEKHLGPFEFLCSAMATGTTFFARIDDDKRELYGDRTWIGAHPSACPFLRRVEDCGICTIHATSPVQCKAYRCTVLRILSPDGSIRGVITGTLALHTDDRALREEWERAQATIVWGTCDT
ncbi:MAG: hypothetical protein LUQ40_03055, partial [Methanomicrobiales archaeon]|nr:hypothetical protein [Methanomicrobiales archaeon]